MMYVCMYGLLYLYISVLLELPFRLKFSLPTLQPAPAFYVVLGTTHWSLLSDRTCGTSIETGLEIKGEKRMSNKLKLKLKYIYLHALESRKMAAMRTFL